MINEIYIDERKDYWVSYGYLGLKGVPEGTLNNWITRNTCIRIYIDGRAYIAYDTIPEQTRSKLPTKKEIKKEYNYARFLRLEESLTEELKTAYDSINMAKWRKIILETYNLPIEQSVIFARKAAVIEQAIDIRNRWYSRIGVLEALYRAYLKIYPDSYSMKNRFCMALTRAEEEGVLSVAVNHKIFNKTEKKFGKLHEYWATVVLTHPRGFSVIDAYNIFCEACKDQNMTTPSFGWFRIFRYNNLNLLEKGSLGKSVYEANNGLYAKIIPALHANSQWQIDGWRIPIYCKKRDEEGKLKPFITYTLFAVMDAHSRKIIGSWIAESENTETILKGLEDAVKNTLCLPYEIVSDNHSFNRTIEAASINGKSTRSCPLFANSK